MSRLQPGPHELGQNFLHDSAVIARIVALVAQTSGPIVEWGTGDGALTRPLARLRGHWKASRSTVPRCGASADASGVTCASRRATSFATHHPQPARWSVTFPSTSPRRYCVTCSPTVRGRTPS